MNKTYITLLALAAPVFALAATQPEQVRDQKAEYNEVTGVVTVSGILPTVAYDPEYYSYEELDHISEVVFERHTPGQPWPDQAEIGRLTDQTPGAELSFEDSDVVPDAKYEYRITCYVDGVRGYSAYANVYTGVTPAALSGFRVFTLSPDDTSVQFSLTAPETSVSGVPLTSLTALDIEAYEMFTYSPLHTIEDIEPGQTYTWTQEGLEPGKTYYYRARARRGETGWGESTEGQTFVGLDAPGLPLNFTAETLNDEQVKLTWDTPAEGLRGGSFYPDEVTYRISRRLLDGDPVTAGVTAPGETSFIDTHNFSEETWVEYVVTPINEAGEGYKTAETPGFVTGAPAQMPFKESFSYAAFTHKGWTRESTQDDPYYTYIAWGAYATGNAYHWGSDSYLPVEPQDQDLGFATCLFYSYSPEGQTEGIVSPRIAIGDNKELALSFFYYDMDEESCGNVVTAAWRAEDGEWNEVFRSVPEEDSLPGWMEAKLTFNVGNAETIQLRIEGVRGGIPIVDVYVDNIQLKYDEGSGIYNIGAADSTVNTTVEYYSLDGRRLSTIPDSGLYLEKRGSQVRKVAK